MKKSSKSQYIEENKDLKNQIDTKSCQIVDLENRINELGQIIQRLQHSNENGKFGLRHAQTKIVRIQNTFTFVVSFLAVLITVLILVR